MAVGGGSKTTTMSAGRSLPSWRSVLAVCAHPDDESFGLGAVLDAFGAQGTRLAVLCLTHGESSTLHGVDPARRGRGSPPGTGRRAALGRGRPRRRGRRGRRAVRLP